MVQRFEPRSYPGPAPVDFDYVLDEHPGADHMAVIITGLDLQGYQVPRPAWPYRPRLADIPAHRLFVQGQVRPLPEPPLDLPALRAFVNAKVDELGFSRRQVSVCGPSLGAAMAIWFGAGDGYAHGVSGAPVVLAREWAKDPIIPDPIRDAVLLSMTDDNSVIPTDTFENFLIEPLRHAQEPFHLEIFVGEEDHFYPRQTDAIQKMAADNPNVRIDLTVAPGIRHDNMYKPFGRFLADALRRRLSQTGSPA